MFFHLKMLINFRHVKYFSAIQGDFCLHFTVWIYRGVELSSYDFENISLRENKIVAFIWSMILFIHFKINDT